MRAICLLLAVSSVLVGCQSMGPEPGDERSI